MKKDDDGLMTVVKKHPTPVGFWLSKAGSSPATSKRGLQTDNDNGLNKRSRPDPSRPLSGFDFDVALRCNDKRAFLPLFEHTGQTGELHIGAYSQPKTQVYVCIPRTMNPTTRKPQFLGAPTGCPDKKHVLGLEVSFQAGKPSFAFVCLDKKCVPDTNCKRVVSNCDMLTLGRYEELGAKIGLRLDFGDATQASETAVERYENDPTKLARLESYQPGDDEAMNPMVLHRLFVPGQDTGNQPAYTDYLNYYIGWNVIENLQKGNRTFWLRRTPGSPADLYPEEFVKGFFMTALLREDRPFGPVKINPVDVFLQNIRRRIVQKVMFRVDASSLVDEQVNAFRGLKVKPLPPHRLDMSVI